MGRECREFELAISIGWLRAVAEQTLEDELVKSEGGKVIKNRFRPFGVVSSLPCAPDCFERCADAGPGASQCAGITPFK